MTVLDQAGRVDEIGTLDGVEDVWNSNSSGEKARGIRRHLKFGDAAALYDDGRNTVQSVETRLQVVGSDLPELVRRHRIGRQTVTNDGKAREGQAMRFHFC